MGHREFIQQIADIKGVTPEEVEKVTEDNAYRLFDKVKRIERG